MKHLRIPFLAPGDQGMAERVALGGHRTGAVTSAEVGRASGHWGVVCTGTTETLVGSRSDQGVRLRTVTA